MENDQSNIEPFPLVDTKTSKKLLKIPFVFLIILLAISVAINIYTFAANSRFFKRINQSIAFNKAKTKEKEVVPTISERDKLINKFNGIFKGKYPDLDERLTRETIQSANPNIQSESYTDYSIWIINTMDMDYLKNSNISPRNSYLVTNNYWKQISGHSLNVECFGKNPIAYNGLPVIIAPLTDFGCDGAVYVYDLQTGDNIPLSDPKKLIPDSKPWILSKDGGANGRVKGTYRVYQQGGKNYWLLNLIYADSGGLHSIAFFNVETGELTNFLNF